MTNLRRTGPRTPAAPRSNEAVIRIRGARTHNLREVHLDLPRNQLVVLTGPSGSGKSSLAFDTLFAEGQRQYIETLSVFARQFLEQVPRPHVDAIEGLQPTLCIDQRPGTPNPRSTVATVTEIYDYLRVLMARLGTAACVDCGRPIRAYTVEEIAAQILTLPEGTRGMILAPLSRRQLVSDEEIREKVRRSGIVRVRVDGEICDLEQLPALGDGRPHSVEGIVDRVVVREGGRGRLADSIRLAVSQGQGLVGFCYADDSEGDPRPLPLDGSRRSSVNTPEFVWREELYSTKYECPDCGISLPELEPRTFSFNSPQGACPNCHGLGRVEAFDPGLVVPDPRRSLRDGAIAPWNDTFKAPVTSWRAVEAFLRGHQHRGDQSLRELPDKAFDALVYGSPNKEVDEFEGLLILLERQFATTTNRDEIQHLTQYRSKVPCGSCDGSRLRAEARWVRLDGRTLPEIVDFPIHKTLEFVQQLKVAPRDEPIAEPLVSAIESRLTFLLRVGLGYLALSRGTDTLSGGEFQRVRLASSVGSGLVGVCYILDEPSIGLHQRDNQRLIETLRNLQQQGNTVLVVEHDEELMRVADRIVDLGPGAGVDGGQVVAEGLATDIAKHPTSLTGAYLSGRMAIDVPIQRRKVVRSRAIRLSGATTHNLKSVDLTLPLGVFVGITGVSGSGKSSLVNHTLVPAVLRRLGQYATSPGPYQSLGGVRQIGKLIRIDQAPLGLSSRGNVATYTGVFDEIRKVFASTPEAKQRGFRVGRFSFNNAGGRCEVCQGMGERRIELGFLPDLVVPCDVCGGSRFNAQTRDIKFRGQSISDVLGMSVRTAAMFFENVATIARVLQTLLDVGLGYLSLGQAATTFSGGEAQRVKIANELARPQSGSTLYVLDEPTTGLHFDDIRRLVSVLQDLVDRGNTVLVIEHNLDVIKSTDWIIDLGPDGGSAGGQIVAEGTPEEIARHPTSYTGKYLKAKLQDV